MKFFYNISLNAYLAIVKLVSIRNRKARLWIEGRKNIFEQLKQAIVPGEPLLWFHASSLGEFEQGRPVIEAVKKQHSEYKILLTFFSPSGYEVRKHYEFADYVFYLPLDTEQNAAQFLDIVKPQKAFFIKYEFWYHYLMQLRNRKVPTYIFSAIFRPSQLFFKPYGKWYREALHAFTHFFVQTEESAKLLYHFGFQNVTVNGDTRVDRVAQIAEMSPQLPKIETFGCQKPIVIAGSTWEKDEEFFIEYLNNCNLDVKFIIAPHEVTPNTIERITTKLQKPFALYSSATDQELQNANVLIIDGYGYLSSVYRYAIVAFIGGGFTTGIHSILEPAAFGLPTIFGPKYQKFKEAHDLIELNGAFFVTTNSELQTLLDLYLTNAELLENASAKVKQYVLNNRGTTNEIIRFIFE